MLFSSRLTFSALLNRFIMMRQKVLLALNQVIVENKIDELLNKQSSSIATYLLKTIENLAWMKDEPSALMFEVDVNSANEQRVERDTRSDDVNKFVDKMYTLYPTKCPKRNTSLGKSRKDKVKIRRLLKTYSQEEIERVIRHEVDSNYGVNYMKNFSTFLNNFPDPNEVGAKDVELPIGKTSDVVIINGQVYK